ncbi:inner membrane protein import complex subunit Tim54-domain-containing protein [Colletotrichum navitas]|uniref:Mitochondrial import inner membrane translocase subunit TIM54 n=1 Tax=Colletotrichum navitas TaxID=681940 RepID=A0AAD8V1L7_9PEZI|nr:inner membrane protein import complex subunit Tim54-domain-containing protein [Colletotrichum navitas]KAK1574485.1 inner membrane protein import complex subunit Tim54-domain-containing protein [Colletotrichum navitas]
MADSKPTPPEAVATSNPTPSTSATATTTNTTATASAAEGYKAAKPNPVWQMMGLRGPPKRLPSRNWMIFLSLTGAFSAAIIYDKREKNRATARWARAVAPLAREPVGSPSQMPRKLTILLEAPPGDGLRVAQDHFLEYVKPILAASGLDWDFVQGRQQGDVRAAVAEKIRRRRSRDERPDQELLPTEENLRDAVRRKNGVPEYDGPAGDIVIGRHTWKEYVRGLHEGWLGPLDPPPKPEAAVPTTSSSQTAEGDDALAGSTEGEKKDDEPPKEEEKKPDRPPQPVPHNTPLDYAASHLPPHIPDEFSPSDAIPFPHLLGFAGTLTRLQRFLTRRRLADDIGRQVAAACFATSREWRGDEEEQQRALEHEQANWVKSVWKEAAEAPESADEAERAKERVWTSPVVVDPRIAGRMRRFEMRPEDEERARQIVVPEEEVEGWIKGSLRSLGRWARDAVSGGRPKGPNVGDIDE